MQMVGEVDLEKIEREESRWRILKVLESGGPGPVSETIILRALCDVELHFTPRDLRRQLDYLKDRKLIELRAGDRPVWTAELTRYGVDLVDYTIECEPGISRPRKWY
jgi:hypothetical protein